MTQAMQAIEGVCLRANVRRHARAAWGARASRCVAAFAFLTAAASQSLAAETFAAPSAAEKVATSSTAGLVQVTISLLLVLAAVFAAAWAMRRLRGFGRLGPGAIEVVGDLALGPRERVVLVQVGKQQLLLGVTAGAINTLHVLPEPIAPAQTGQDGTDASSGAPTVPPHLQFKTILKRSLGL
mgnify:CR=1 FL=1